MPSDHHAPRAERAATWTLEESLRGRPAAEKLEPAAVRFHGRLALEARTLTLREAQLALAALGTLCEGDRDPSASPASGRADASATGQLRVCQDTDGCLVKSTHRF
jgi:hypothetical protein